jgi:hypothetical protein
MKPLLTIVLMLCAGLACAADARPKPEARVILQRPGFVRLPPDWLVDHFQWPGRAELTLPDGGRIIVRKPGRAKP